VVAGGGAVGTAQAPTTDTAPAKVPARRPVTAAKAPAPPPENSRVAVSEPVPQRQEPRPVSAHTTVAQNSVETCKDKFFLLKEYCLAEQCEKPGARNHALCAKRREEAKLREDSRVRN